jgi:hypothetical protein
MSTRKLSDRPRDVEYVNWWLRRAGMTLMALPHTGPTLGIRLRSLEIVHAVEDAQEERRMVNRWQPSSHDIAAMDAVFPAWLQFIPVTNHKIRLTIGLRSLIRPSTERHIWTWKRIGDRLHCSDEWARQWHAKGVDMIVGALCAIDQGGEQLMSRKKAA